MQKNTTHTYHFLSSVLWTIVCLFFHWSMYFLFFYLQLLIMITPLICSNLSYFAMFVDCQFNSADHNWKCIVNMTRLYLNLCTSVLGGVRVARSLAFCVVLLVDRCFSFLPFLFWPLCCFFFFFDLWILITSLVYFKLFLCINLRDTYEKFKTIYG